MKHPRALGALIAAIALTAPACGKGEPATKAATAKTVEVAMTDNKFTPSSFRVDAGQKVTFRFTNDGTVAHEAILGDEAAQADHEAEMADAGSGESMDGMDGMDHGGSNADAITVEPGKTATLTTTIDDPGTLILGCHVPGHYDAGMKATITAS